MNSAREIVKYPNRRLYDTELRSYVTLVDLRQMVLDGVDFTVIEKSTGSDITRSILLIIISEQERGNTPVLTLGSLRAVIRRQIHRESDLNGVSFNGHSVGPGPHGS